MPMTPVVPVDYGALLNDARAKYHALMTGNMASVYVDQNGERIEYKAANAGTLLSYIRGLEQLVGVVPAGGLGPMRVWF